MRFVAFCLGLTLAAVALPCAAQTQEPAAVAAPVPTTKPSGHRNECHHNAKGQLVCRQCWNEAGKVRCGKPRIVKTETPSSD